MPMLDEKTKDDVPDVILELARHIGGIKGVDKVVLFGSRARGDHAPRADVDIAVYGRSLPESSWPYIKGMVENTPTLLKIDCVRYESADRAFQEQIDRDGVVLYGG